MPLHVWTPLAWNLEKRIPLARKAVEMGRDPVRPPEHTDVRCAERFHDKENHVRFLPRFKSQVKELVPLEPARSFQEGMCGIDPFEQLRPGELLQGG